MLEIFMFQYHLIQYLVLVKIIKKLSGNDVNAVIQTADKQFKTTIDKIEWLLPNARLSYARKFKLLKYIEKYSLIPISFHSWELYEYHLLPITSNHVWTIKTSTRLEKPRFFILGFQTKRQNVNRRNASHFDHCKITNVSLFLSNLNLDIDKKQFALPYEMYINFQTKYYCREP